MPMTPDDWRARLDLELSERLPFAKLCSDYYNGDHRLQFATSKFKEAFGELFGAFATNWCGLVVDVAVERLGIQGFRFGEDDADAEAWGIWQANGLDAKSISGHTEAVKTGAAFLLVGPPREPGGEPLITVEHPFQCVVAHDPADRRRRLAAYKKYVDYEGNVISVVYLPGSITTYKRSGIYQRLSQLEALGVYLPPTSGGDWDTVRSEDNPLGIVPMVALENAPNLLTGGVSDLKPAIALNDAANKFFTDMIHASEYTSFPQRVLTGVELPKDPLTGEVADTAQIQAAVSRLWAFEDPAANVHDLRAGDLSNYVEGVDLAVQHLAAQTRTPPHYLLAKLANLSGDALKAAETGLVSRCKRKHVDFSDPWEEAMRLAFRWRSIDRAGWVGAEDDARRADMTDAETLWTDPESKNASSEGDSLVKKKQINVPDEVLWEEAGYSPPKIKRMIKLRDEQVKREQEQMAAQAAITGGGAAPGQPAGSVSIAPAGGKLEVSGLPGPAPAPTAPKPTPTNA